jgi:hypothetical protein
MAADGGQARRDGHRDVGPEPQLAFALDDRWQDVLEQDRLAAGDVLAALDPGEDEEVLDQAVQPLRLGRDIGQELIRHGRIEPIAPAEEHLAAA